MSEHPRGRVVGWVLLALAGLAVAVALSVAASNLSTQPIGLSAEPLRAGDKLAPASVTNTTTRKVKRKARKQATQTATTPTVTATPTATAPSTTSSGTGSPDGDDHGGPDVDHDDD